MTELIKAADELASAVHDHRTATDARNYLSAAGRVKSALTAYRTARESAGEVKVTPLEWWDNSGSSGWLSKHEAGNRGEIPAYTVTCSHSTGQQDWTLKVNITGKQTRHKTLDQAKAAAQADHEARTRSALA